jgi:hypothetical protein
VLVDRWGFAHSLTLLLDGVMSDPRGGSGADERRSSPTATGVKGKAAATYSACRLPSTVPSGAAARICAPVTFFQKTPHRRPGRAAKLLRRETQFLVASSRACPLEDGPKEPARRGACGYGAVESLQGDMTSRFLQAEAAMSSRTPQTLTDTTAS